MSVYVWTSETRFYESIGFEENTGHLVYCVDERPYVRRRQDG